MIDEVNKMAKFDPKKMRELNASKAQRLGSNLLNLEDEENVTYIDFEKLRVHKSNTYSVVGIDDLADEIDQFGLLEALVVVVREDGFYDILSGQRRYLAIAKIREEKAEKFEKVKCVVQDIEKMKLNIPGLTNEEAHAALSKEDIEEQLISMYNGYRSLTTMDLMIRAKAYERTYQKLKEAGAKNLGRRIEFVAQELDVSPKQAQIILEAEEKMVPELKDVISDDEDISPLMASKLSKLSEEQQEVAVTEIQKSKEDGDKIDYKEVLKTASQEIKEEDEPVVKAKRAITKDVLRNHLHTDELISLEAYLTSELLLDESQFDKLEDISGKIQKLKNQALKILEDASNQK